MHFAKCSINRIYLLSFTPFPITRKLVQVYIPSTEYMYTVSRVYIVGYLDNPQILIRQL